MTDTHVALGWTAARTVPLGGLLAIPAGDIAILAGCRSLLATPRQRLEVLMKCAINAVTLLPITPNHPISIERARSEATVHQDAMLRQISALHGKSQWTLAAHWTKQPQQPMCTQSGQAWLASKAEQRNATEARARVALELLHSMTDHFGCDDRCAETSGRSAKLHFMLSNEHAAHDLCLSAKQLTPNRKGFDLTLVGPLPPLSFVTGFQERQGDRGAK